MSTSGNRDPAPSGSGSRRPTMDSKDGPKVAKPDFYYGEREKLEDWLMQLQLYFAFNGSALPAGQQPAFAITYMRGRAQKWVHSSLKKYLEDKDNEDNKHIKQWMESFARFRVEIRRVFGPSNESKAATRIIQHLSQKKSAAEYSTQFQQYASRTDWDDNALMTMYRRGLSEGGMSPQDINDKTKKYLILKGHEGSELEGVLQHAVKRAEDNVAKLQQQLQNIRQGKEELESSDDGEVLEYSSEHGQEDEEISKEVTSLYTNNEGVPNNSQACASASHGSDKEDNSNKTQRQTFADLLNVKDYRNDANHPQHGVPLPLHGKTRGR